MDFEVGQTLWWEYDDTYSNTKRTGYEVTITKIGRTWLYLNNNHRVDKTLLIADGKGYSSPGKCYLSKKDCDNLTALINEWRLLRELVGSRYNPPCSVTAKSIQQARELLGLYSTESP
jgi:hypothetical protein